MSFSEVRNESSVQLRSKRAIDPVRNTGNQRREDFGGDGQCGQMWGMNEAAPESDKAVPEDTVDLIGDDVIAVLRGVFANNGYPFFLDLVLNGLKV